MLVGRNLQPAGFENVERLAQRMRAAVVRPVPVKPVMDDVKLVRALVEFLRIEAVPDHARPVKPPLVGGLVGIDHDIHLRQRPAQFVRFRLINLELGDGVGIGRILSDERNGAVTHRDHRQLNVLDDTSETYRPTPRPARRY